MADQAGIGLIRAALSTGDAGKLSNVPADTNAALALKVDKTTTVNTKPLSANVALTLDDVPATATKTTVPPADASKLAALPSAAQYAIDLGAKLTGDVNNLLLGGAAASAQATLAILGTKTIAVPAAGSAWNAIDFQASTLTLAAGGTAPNELAAVRFAAPVITAGGGSAYVVPVAATVIIDGAPAAGAGGGATPTLTASRALYVKSGGVGIGVAGSGSPLCVTSGTYSEMLRMYALPVSGTGDSATLDFSYSSYNNGAPDNDTFGIVFNKGGTVAAQPIFWLFNMESRWVTGSGTTNGILEFYGDYTPVGRAAGNTYRPYSWAIDQDTHLSSMAYYRLSSFRLGNWVGGAETATLTWTGATGLLTVVGNISATSYTIGSWAGQAITTAKGGTGADTSASSGVVSINAGTWLFNATTANYVLKTGASNAVANSQIQDDGTKVGVGGAGVTGAKLSVYGPTFLGVGGGNLACFDGTSVFGALAANVGSDYWYMGYAATVATTATEVLVWNKNGNVLIGTTTDAAASRLNVVASRTVASAAGAVWDGVKFAASTLTLTGSVQCNASINFVNIAAPTITDASAVTVDKAATVYIDGPPVAAGSVTLTAAASLVVASGNVGIGTATPTADLEIRKASGYPVFVIGKLSANEYFGVSWDVAGQRALFQTYNNAYPYLFGSAASPWLYVAGNATNGGAGIGVTSLAAASAFTVNASRTVASAAGAVWDGINFAASTLTLTGTTQCNGSLNFVNIAAPTITDGDAVTVDKAATVYIAGPPVAAGSVTLTSTAALVVASGNVGIGTDAPRALFDIGPSAIDVSAPSLTAINGKMLFGRSGDSGYAALEFGTEGANGGWLQYANSVLAGRTTYPLRINPLGGYVGVGVVTPGYALDVGGDIHLTGRILGAQGADVVAANDITLGNGNYFDLTGATEVQRILGTGWTAGSIVTLQFDANPNVKHNTAAGGGYYGFQLAGAGDFAASAGDTLTLRFDGAWWRETGRTVI